MKKQRRAIGAAQLRGLRQSTDRRKSVTVRTIEAACEALLKANIRPSPTLVVERTDGAIKIDSVAKRTRHRGLLDPFQARFDKANGIEAPALPEGKAASCPKCGQISSAPDANAIRRLEAERDEALDKLRAAQTALSKMDYALKRAVAEKQSVEQDLAQALASPHPRLARGSMKGEGTVH